MNNKQLESNHLKLSLQNKDLKRITIIKELIIKEQDNQSNKSNNKNIIKIVILLTNYNKNIYIIMNLIIIHP